MQKIAPFYLLLLSFLVAPHLLATVRLPAIIGNHMVLQQHSQVKIWGWCDPAEIIKITTTWDTATYTTTGESGAKWSTTLQTPTSGGPYTITITGSNTIVINDVLIGEVWLCSGQSNMEMSYNWGVTRYANDMNKASNNNIRFFQIVKSTAQYPQDDLKGRWIVCSPEEAKQLSLVAYFFGNKLQQELKTPVGLISSSWGGTPAEVWTPEEKINNHPALKKAAQHIKPYKSWPVYPGATFNAMIHPITAYNIAGALWYQGESNVGADTTYQLLLTNLITGWRQAWQKEFPFYFVQIAPYAGYGNNNAAALLRETQTNTLTVPKTGMVVTSDLVHDVKDIHPHPKKEVGLRLANMALAETYGKTGIAYKSPLYKSMHIEKNKIRITFTNAEKGLISKEGTPTEFYIAGEDKNFVAATAKIEGNTVLVWSDNVNHPVAVRFGFTNKAMPNLFSKEGLPVNLFRTDNWQVNINEQ